MDSGEYVNYKLDVDPVYDNGVSVLQVKFYPDPNNPPNPPHPYTEFDVELINQKGEIVFSGYINNRYLFNYPDFSGTNGFADGTYSFRIFERATQQVPKHLIRERTNIDIKGIIDILTLNLIEPIEQPTAVTPKGKAVFEVNATKAATVTAIVDYSITIGSDPNSIYKDWETVTPPSSPDTHLTFTVNLDPGTYMIRARSKSGPTGNHAQDGQLLVPMSLKMNGIVINPTCLKFGSPAFTLPNTTRTLGQNDGSITIHTEGGAGTIKATISYQGDIAPLQTKEFGATDKKYTFNGLSTGFYDISIQDKDTYPLSMSCSPPAVLTQVEVSPPPLQIGDQLSFLPWAQYKLSRAASIIGDMLRPGIKLSVIIAKDTVDDATPLQTNAELFGPGDVVGLNTRAILGTTPDPDEAQFSPLQLASIEFKEEDLPWRYSARQSSDATNNKPWCFLMVLEEKEYSVIPKNSAPLPSIQILASASFPEPGQQHLWAHVQINQQLEVKPPVNSPQPGAVPYVQPTVEEVEAFLNGPLQRNPDLAYSRLFCPRRLQPATSYQAFLLPATEAGRLAGLGDVLTAGSATKHSWDNLSVSRQFPVYYHWKFTTGESADFESLIRQLHPVANNTLALEDIAVEIPGRSLPLDPIAMPGVVISTGAQVGEPSPLVSMYLYNELQPGFTTATSTHPVARPVVTAPLYGRAYMDEPELRQPDATLPADQKPRDWKHQVNLDPRYRIVASLGAQLVQEKQEEYVNRAWNQVNDILLANQKLRGAQYGLRTTAGLRDQHLPELGTSAETLGLHTQTGTDKSTNAIQSSAGYREGTGIEKVPVESGLSNYGLQLTSLALRRIKPENMPFTVQETIRQSDMPLAVFSPAFRRITRPFGRFQAGQSGPPRRLTQNPLDKAPKDMVGVETTLAQRDTLITLIHEGSITPATPVPAHIRGYQFDDAVIDNLLKLPGVKLTPRILERGNYLDTADLQNVFTETFDSFKKSRENTPIEFKKEPRQLPALQLEQIKSAVVEGTKPEKLFLARIKQAIKGFNLAAAAGDFDPADFDSNDFFTGLSDSLEVSAAAAAERSFSDQSVTPIEFSAAEPALEKQLPAAESLIFSSRLNTAGNKAGGTTSRTDKVTAELPVIPQIMAGPVFKDAMGELLRQRHPELFLPGIGNFPANGIAMLSINHAFIEAFLLGANHALGSELLWRQFPTDLRGSYFQQFWDVSEQINMDTDDTLSPAQLLELETRHLDVWPLHLWGPTRLGGNSKNVTGAKLMLAIRSDLIRRYPNLVICAQAANANGQFDSNGIIKYPQKQMPVGQDITTVSFDLEQSEAVGNDGKNGYFIVFMERPGQPQFGLDEHPAGTPAPTPRVWDELTWEYMGTPVGANLTIDPAGKPQATADPVPHIKDSAQLAYALFQKPIRAAIHASTLLKSTP